MEEKHPKPKRKPRKKPPAISTREKDSIPNPTPTPEIAAKVKALSPEENKMFLRQLDQFLNKKMIATKKENQEDYKILYSNITEFLESFITIGYTFNGQRILIQHYPTPRDRDAMMEYLKNVFIHNNAQDVTFFEKDDNIDNE